MHQVLDERWARESDPKYIVQFLGQLMDERDAARAAQAVTHEELAQAFERFTVGAMNLIPDDSEIRRSMIQAVGAGFARMAAHLRQIAPKPEDAVQPRSLPVPPGPHEHNFVGDFASGVSCACGERHCALCLYVRDRSQPCSCGGRTGAPETAVPA